MCGIFGIWYFDGRAVEESDVVKSRDEMLSRGPDDAGIYVEGGVGLGHRRLSIIDLSPRGRQPMSNEMNDILLVFNGEIYNFLQLRPLLEEKGHKFKSDTDTEVIIHAYEEWGTECFEKFNGMFAVGIYDRRNKTMVLARDRIGKKPLYYTLDGKRLIFASTLRPLMKWGDFDKKIDYRSLCEFMYFGFFPERNSIFKNTFKVEPGSYVVVNSNGGLFHHTYWDINGVKTEEYKDKSEADYTAQLEELLTEAVRRRMVADVPLGAFLSGGVDSSLVVALMAKISGSPIKTFTIGQQNMDLNEATYAQKAAAYLGLENISLFVDKKTALDLVMSVPDIIDEPFGDSSIIPTYLVSKLAREQVTVVLSGDGGDELFGGYATYPWIKRADLFFKLVPKAVRKPISAIGRVGALNIRTKKAFWALGAGSYAEFYSFIKTLDTCDYEAVIPKLSFTLEEHFLKETTAFPSDDLVKSAMFYETRYNLGEGIMQKVDRATMAVSLESRAPFLDYEVVEFAAKLPTKMKVKKGVTKHILKKIVFKYIPDKMFERRKQGFSIPLKEWMRNEIKELIVEKLSEKRISQSGFFDPEAVNRLLSEHLSRKNSYTNILWRILCFELWKDKYLG